MLLSAEAQDVGRQRERGGGAPDEPRELKEVLVEMAERYPGPEEGTNGDAGAAAAAGPASEAEYAAAAAPQQQRPQGEQAPFLATSPASQSSAAGGAGGTGGGGGAGRFGRWDTAEPPRAAGANGAGLLEARRAMCDAQPGIAEVVTEAAHFIDFALGAYGWCEDQKLL